MDKSAGPALGKVGIRRGIWQGDSLIPMTSTLREVNAAYSLGKHKPFPNHLFSMVMILFRKCWADIDKFEYTVYLLNIDICMEFGSVE